MKLDKISIDGKKDSIEVLDKIFSAKINHKLVSAVLYKTNANYKGRHAKTKQQNEVKGPTSKIYAQKGTGGARHASRKAPIFVGGGIAHGPKGELAYKKRKLNKTEKKQSVASLITEKNNNKNLLILNDFSSEIKKTKEMNSIINKLEITNSLIILDKNSKEKIEKFVIPKKYNWKHLLSGNGTDNFVLKFNVSGFPTKFIIDPSGKTLYRFVGGGEDSFKVLDELLK
jgi:large subunit ribosomal protein L4